MGRQGYVITHAPLVVKDMVIVGVGGGDGPNRGFIAAFDVRSGDWRWKFHIIPDPGKIGNDSWLDRATGQFLLGKPFVQVNWMTGFDSEPERRSEH